MTPYKIVPLAVLALLIAPGLAFAGDASAPQPTLALPTDQIWTLLAGAIAALPTYLLNKHAPWNTDQVKLLAHVIAAAIAGGITQAVTAGGVGFNNTTLQFVVTAVVSALGAHLLAWKPSGVAATLGAGQNA